MENEIDYMMKIEQFLLNLTNQAKDLYIKINVLKNNNEIVDDVTKNDMYSILNIFPKEYLLINLDINEKNYNELNEEMNMNRELSEEEKQIKEMLELIYIKIQ